MKLAGSLELEPLLIKLATWRAVFHSEADFQHAFAWYVQCQDPSMAVRLETHPEPSVRLDVHLHRPDLGRHTAVELKYPTALWTGEVGAEHFALKNHGAQDVRSYDIVHDVHRVERFVDGRAGWNGAVIVLTNEPSYWRLPAHERQTNAAAFRTHDGLTLAGNRGWGSNTGAGTRKGRDAAIPLRGSYPLRWVEYSRLDGRSGNFRLLLIPIE